MYQQVYFHKVNTLTQTYLRRLLVREHGSSPSKASWT